jgi:hypothetical protein
VLLDIRAFRYMRFSVEALFGIGAFGYMRLWVRKPMWTLQSHWSGLPVEILNETWAHANEMTVLPFIPKTQ